MFKLSPFDSLTSFHMSAYVTTYTSWKSIKDDVASSGSTANTLALAKLPQVSWKDPVGGQLDNLKCYSSSSTSDYKGVTSYDSPLSPAIANDSLPCTRFSEKKNFEMNNSDSESSFSSDSSPDWKHSNAERSTYLAIGRFASTKIVAAYNDFSGSSKTIGQIPSKRNYERRQTKNYERNPKLTPCRNYSIAETREWVAKRKLKDVVKLCNQNFVEKMEEEYYKSNKKKTPLALILADVYINGKRAEKDTERGLRILSESTLPEAKYRLIKIWIDTEHYADAYYQALHFSFLNCFWEQPETKKSPIYKRSLTSPITKIPKLEKTTKTCYRHLIDSLINSICDKIGEKEAECFRKEGTKKGYTPTFIPE